MPGVFGEPHIAAGVGWQASIVDGQVELTVDPDADDALEQALDELLAPAQRRYWNLRFLYVDDDEQDVWLLERVGSSILADALGRTHFPARPISKLRNGLVTVPA